MTSQGHVTTASVKQAHREGNREIFLSAYISKNSADPSLKLLTVNWGTLNSMMYKFDHDQTNSHRVISKRFGVEECWSYISSFFVPTIYILFYCLGQAYIFRTFTLIKQFHLEVNLISFRGQSFNWYESDLTDLCTTETVFNNFAPQKNY